MKGSDFVNAYRQANPFAWEKAALELYRQGHAIDWPWVPIQVEDKNGNRGEVRVASDYFSVGTPDDFLRLPLLPRTAQNIANLTGLLLPTPKLVYETWRQAPVKLTPVRSGALAAPFKANMGANLPQYAAHNAAIEAERAGRVGLLSGAKKDIVMYKGWAPGKVLIYGWFWPDARPLKEAMSDDAQPIQPRSNAHGDFYVDYSHGVRFVHPFMKVNGEEVPVEAVLASPALAGLVNDEGPLKVVRYPADITPAPVRPYQPSALATRDYVVPRNGPPADVGLAVMSMLSRKNPT